MNEKSEKKIQDEIQKRIWEEEEFLSSEGMQDKTHITQIKALGISTFLQREDVERIVKSVRYKFEKKERILKWILIPAALCIIIGGIIFFVINWFTSPSSESEKNSSSSIFATGESPATDENALPVLSGAFEEPFDNGKNGWFIGEDFVYKGVIEDGHYVFEGGEDYQCYGDKISVKFPNQYAVELTSTWKRGNFDLYGFSLSQDGKGHVFPLKGDGTASYASLSEGMPEFNDPWDTDKANSGDGKISNVQRVEISDNTFKYFINGKLLKKGDSDGIRLSEIVIHCCGKQRVEFNHLKVVTLDQAAKVILDESFENRNAGWSPETIFSKRCYFENGEYIFSTNKEEACNLSLISVNIEKNICIRLDSIWKRGENSPYGLLLMKDDDNYLFYQLQKNRSARFIQVVDGNLKYNSEWKEIGNPDDENKKDSQSVTIKEKKFQYNVNGAMLEEWENPEPFKINRIGVELCGKQAVAFDHLSVTKAN